MRNNTRTGKKKNNSRIGTAIAVAATSGVALAVLSIAVLTAVYCRSLLNVEYIGENDMYTE